MASPATLLYEQRDFPVFQNRMYGSYADARACSRGDIRLVRDADTGLVYNQAFCPELLQYDCHYQNEQAVSAAFQRHLGEVASIVGTQLGHDGLIEVGCGKGYFLELLNKNGFTVRGFDPAYEGDNQRIERRCFDPTIGLTSKGLILRHVLEHMPGPLDFLKQLRAANGCAGLIYIEVPCLDWIRERRAWFDIYYEHVNYFRLSDFHRIFEDIRVAGRLFGGQYLYVVAELASLREPVSGVEESFRLPDDFLSGIAGSRQQAAGSRQRVGVWGGASKGVIFALLRERLGQPVDVVIDVNPAKQSRFLPATGLMVHAPAQGLAQLPAGSPLYIMNSNYSAEIRSMSGGRYDYIEVEHDGI